MSAMPLQYEEVEYPESDGKPMAETGIHVEELLNLLSSLIDRYQGVPDVYVAGNNFFYYVEGNPRYAVSPDVYVVRPRGSRGAGSVHSELNPGDTRARLPELVDGGLPLRLLKDHFRPA